jgi:hypothetical protein
MNLVYIDIQDFFQKSAACKRLSRQEEIDCAIRMKAGDSDARERIIQSYLPIIAGHIKRLPEHMQTLGCALYFQSELEKAIDCFDFVQYREPFMNRINWIGRQAMTKYLARRG